MARGKTLLKLLDDLRAEAGLSLNPAHNQQIREVHVMHLQRVQETYWDDFAWPHLRVERDQSSVVGQRYYGPPDDLPIERLEWVQVFCDGAWCTLRPEIRALEYAIFNSDIGDRSWPPSAWRLHEDTEIEIWPVPDTATDPATQEGTLRFVGIRKLRPLVDDADTADLDDRLIVLTAAAEILAGAGNKLAALKLSMAQQRYERLKAELTKSSRFQMFRTGRQDAPRRPAIGVYKPPVIY